MAEHNALGCWGENIAAEHMIKLGYAIIDRNVKVGNYELDIIASRGDIIAFIEVKTRSDDFVDPIEAITPKKMRYMAKAANSYIIANGIKAEPQFDVISIIGEPGGEFRLEHYPDAFFPPLITR